MRILETCREDWRITHARDSDPPGWQPVGLAKMFNAHGGPWNVRARTGLGGEAKDSVTCRARPQRSVRALEERSHLVGDPLDAAFVDPLPGHAAERREPIEQRNP